MIFDPFECCKLKPNKLYSTIVDATFKAALQYFGNVLPDGTQINSRDYSEYTSMKDRVIQYAISGTEYRIKMVFWNLAANQRYYLKRLLSIILRFGLHGNISKEKQYLIAGCDVKRCEIPISESRTKNAYFRKYFSKGPLKDERMFVNVVLDVGRMARAAGEKRRVQVRNMLVTLMGLPVDIVRGLDI
jgi:hypothetical protein